MEPTVRNEGMPAPDQRDFSDAPLHGGLSLAAGLTSLLSPFLTGPIFSEAPLWMFVVGVAFCVTSWWLAALAVRAPAGSRGRGTAAAGIVLSILGFLFCGFLWIVGSIVLNDTTL
jgi:hypothetical protein